MSQRESEGMVKDTIKDVTSFYEDSINFINSCEKPMGKGKLL